MKKLSTMIIAVILVAVSAVSVFAAGINSNEQAVLDELKASVAMKDGEMFISAEFINQAENYFNTIDMTADESKDIIAIIKEGKTFLQNSGAANIADLTFSQKQTLLSYGEKVVGVLGMTMSYDKSTQTLAIYAPDGSTAFSAVPTLTKAASGSSTTGSTTGSTTNKVGDNNVIKTTGADANFIGFAVLGAVAVALVAGGTLYLVKTKKEA